MRVYDYTCGEGHVHERFVKDEYTVWVPCTQCKSVAWRLPPAPRAKLEGFSGHFPGAADKWERNRASHMAKERKSMESHGEYLNGRPVGDGVPH